MGRPLPGYHVALLDEHDRDADEGEIALPLNPPPLGLMRGYLDEASQSTSAHRGGYYRTGDIATRDADGYVTYVGRSDDVFKSSDYRISPFELESAIVEHPDIAEAAVVPSPDPLRLSVPKAFVAVRAGTEPSRDLALRVFRFLRGRLPRYKRIRCIEFAELPKTISGKIRRVELRALEVGRRRGGARVELEFWEQEFPELSEAPAGEG
jgi:acetyl-CoA synthetase